MLAHQLRKYVRRRVGGVGLEGIQRGHANVQAVAAQIGKLDLRHILWVSSQRDNAEAIGIAETQVRKVGETPRRVVQVERSTEYAEPGLVDRSCSQSLGVAHHELLRPRWRASGKARHRGKAAL